MIVYQFIYSALIGPNDRCAAAIPGVTFILWTKPSYTAGYRPYIIHNIILLIKLINQEIAVIIIARAQCLCDSKWRTACSHG